ncbi:MAG: queuosine precursor transporter [Bacteroidetes bacterium]|nr:queuosine precursor transporter [Bacteroidota bacterium]
MKQYKYFSTITGLFCACLVISNILDTKLFSLFGFIFPTGIILFPIVYVFGDLFTEVYGYRYSRKAIWAGFFSLLILVVSLELAKFLKPAPIWNHQSEFEIILGKVYRIAAASILAFVCGEFVNSYTMAKLKIRQSGKAMPIRFVLSTLFGQMVDTAVFICVAFIGTIELSSLIHVFIAAWTFKVLWEVFALPVSVVVVTKLKKIENEDYYDIETNFNPFKVD